MIFVQNHVQALFLLKILFLKQKYRKKAYFLPIFARKTKNPYKTTYFP